MTIYLCQSDIITQMPQTKHCYLLMMVAPVKSLLSGSNFYMGGGEGGVVFEFILNC